MKVFGIQRVDQGDNDALRESAGEIVRHNAAEYNNKKMLEAKWKPALNCNLLRT